MPGTSGMSYCQPKAQEVHRTGGTVGKLARSLRFNRAESTVPRKSARTAAEARGGNHKTLASGSGLDLRVVYVHICVLRYLTIPLPSAGICQ